MFNEREKLILQVLLKNNEQLSIKEIAKATKIKERTLYREIKNLESSLQALDIDLIKEKSKYYLSGNIESLDPHSLKLVLKIMHTLRKLG